MAGPNDPIKPDPKMSDIIVVDLGKKDSKQIKRLRNGKGKLLEKVKQCIEELRSSGKITGTVQPLVVVVEEEAVAPWNFMKMMNK